MVASPPSSGSSKESADWLQGRIYPSGPSGTFPPSYCWELDSHNYTEPGENQGGGGGSRDASGRVEKFAKVLHSMKAQLPEEMDLVEGDIIRVVQIIDKDWYR